MRRDYPLMAVAERDLREHDQAGELEVPVVDALRDGA